MMEADSGTIRIENYSYDAVMLFLEYLYSGELDIEKYNFEFLIELMQISDEYVMDELYKTCQKKLKSKIDVSNVSDILVAADSMNLSELKTECLEMIVRHFSEIITKESYNRLIKSPHLLIEITKELANQLHPSSE